MKMKKTEKKKQIAALKKELAERRKYCAECEIGKWECGHCAEPKWELKKNIERLEKEITAMDDQALEDTRLHLIQRIEALPGKFELYGETFSWVERRDYLIITGTGTRITYHLTKEGTILSYSFSSSSGSSADAAHTVQYYQTCIHLLSESFRQQVIADYQLKKADLRGLEEEYQQITRELESRKNAREEALKTEAEAHRKEYELIGSVWYDFEGGCGRHTVASTTEKSIYFWGWQWKNGQWEKADWLNRRKTKDALRKGCMKPLGTTDLASQKSEVPQTVEYR
jgi:hypothetical protein